LSIEYTKKEKIEKKEQFIEKKEKDEVIAACLAHF
jgi:hypothetical protein